MKKFPKLSKSQLKCIDSLDKKQHSVNFDDFQTHVKFIGKYCFKNNLSTLSFKRGKGTQWNGDCSFYNYLDFMTPAQRRDVEKQIKELKK